MLAGAQTSRALLATGSQSSRNWSRTDTDAEWIVGDLGGARRKARQLMIAMRETNARSDHQLKHSARWGALWGILPGRFPFMTLIAKCAIIKT